MKPSSAAPPQDPSITCLDSYTIRDVRHVSIRLIGGSSLSGEYIVSSRGIDGDREYRCIFVNLSVLYTTFAQVDIGKYFPSPSILSCPLPIGDQLKMIHSLSNPILVFLFNCYPLPQR